MPWYTGFALDTFCSVLAYIQFVSSPALVDPVEGLVGGDEDGAVAGGHQLHHKLFVVLHQLVELVETVELALLCKGQYYYHSKCKIHQLFMAITKRR